MCCIVPCAERLSKTAVDSKWNCVKLRCIQPYTTGRQFGLRFVKLISNTTCSEQTHTNLQSVVSNNRSSLSSPPPRSPGLSSISLTPKHPNTGSQEILGTPKIARGMQSPVARWPRLPTLSSNKGRSETGVSPLASRLALHLPKDNRQDNEEEEEDGQEFEFAGIENQSRLLKGTVTGDKDLIRDNSLLEKIASERGRSAEQENESPGYCRRKLLHKGLTKASAAINIANSYSSDQCGSKAFATLSHLGKEHFNILQCRYCF